MKAEEGGLQAPPLAQALTTRKQEPMSLIMIPETLKPATDLRL